MYIIADILAYASDSIFIQSLLMFYSTKSLRTMLKQNYQWIKTLHYTSIDGMKRFSKCNL